MNATDRAEDRGFRMSRHLDEHDFHAQLLVGTPDIAERPKRWEIEVEGDAIHLRGDGKHIVTVRDNVHRKGYLGFWGFRGREVRIDNVAVCSPAAERCSPACAGR